MSFVADLHIHSHFAAACSKELTLPNLAKWATRKGIDVMGTGDALHPGWLNEIKPHLIDNQNGTYTYDKAIFIPTAEVACIYPDKGKSRRIHLLLFFPSLETTERLQQTLSKLTDLTYDGRPILTLSAKTVCELAWGVDQRILIIPAHAWTPWFSVYGSIGGYDSLADCFEEYTDQIYAVETGLSSEPRMNWRVKELDKKSIVSFSDAHSLPRLGREVTVFDTEPSFEGLTQALKRQRILETIEFFPEEGKYHFTGHRKCSVVRSPEETRKEGYICPVCKRKLTLGVAERIEHIATRTEAELKIAINGSLVSSRTLPTRPPFRMLVQLEEIIADALHKGVRTQTVQKEYNRLIESLGAELPILISISFDQIEAIAGPRITEGIRRVRAGQVTIQPGYDNSYGKISIIAN